MKKLEWSVYVLRDPITKAVRYIGVTCKPLEVRLAEHLKDTRHNTRKANWIKHLKKSGLSPQIIKLEDFSTKNEACSKEITYIKKYKDDGIDLVNLSNGGEAVMFGRKHSDETKKKMSLSRQGSDNAFFGKRHSPEARSQMSKSHLGHEAWNKNKRLSKEHREKLSETHKGKATWNKGKSRVDLDEVIRLIDAGNSQTTVGRMLGINQGYVSRIYKKRKR